MLPPAGRRSLFRAGDARAQPGRAAVADGRARYYRRLARLHAKGRRPFLVRAAIPRQELFLWHRAGAVAGRALCLAAHRPRHQPRGARGDFRGRGCGRRARHRCAAREAARDHHQRVVDGAWRRHLRPVFHVSQPRHGVGHRGVAADRVRGHRRRRLFAAGADGRRAADIVIDRGAARVVRHQFHRRRQHASCSFSASSSCRRASSARSGA